MKKEQRKRIRLALTTFLLCGIGMGGVAEVNASIVENSSNEQLYLSGTTVGTDSDGSVKYITAYGYRTSVGGKYATAIGFYAQATAYDATAIGEYTEATARDSTALGASAKAKAESATALGYAANALAEYSAAIEYATTNGNYSFAAAYNAKTYGKGSVAIGYSSSAGDTSALATTDMYATAVGGSSSASNTYATALGYCAKATKSYSISIGSSSAGGEQSVAIGRFASASGKNSVAIGGNESSGSGAQASNEGATAVGDLSNAYATYTTALGYSSYANGSYSISLGDSSATQAQSIAIGRYAYANSTNAVAIGGNSASGKGAQATGTSATAVGDSSSAGNTYATALGFQANASGNSSYAAGANTTASGTDAVAIGGSSAAGGGATASGDYAMAFGYGSIGHGNDSAALGESSKSYGAGSTAVGYYAIAGKSTTAKDTATYATAVGRSAQATATSATSLGDSAKAVATNAVAIGKSAAAGKSTTSGSTTTTTGASAVALGDSASAEKDYSMALGYSASATGDNAISIGDSTASETGTIAVGRRAKASGLYGIAIGSGDDAQETLAYGASSVAVGRNAKSYGGGSVAYGFYASAGSSSSSGIEHATALGSNAEASNTNTVALGYKSKAKGSNAISIGNSSAGADDAIAIGQSANATLGNAIALGKSATASVADTIAIGESASAGGAKGVAIGQGAQAGSANAVALGDSSVTSEADSVSVGASTSKTRTITNVTAGDSTKDAAIWDQIAATGKTVELSTDTRDTVGTKTVKKNEIGTNDGTVLATFKTMTAVAADDTGFVSGDDLYTELRPSSGNYISDQATKTNLSALDTAIGKTADGNYISEQNGTSVTVATNLKALDDAIGAKLSDDGNYILKANTVVANLSALDTKIGAAKGLTGVYEATDDVETQIQNTAKKTIKSVSAATSNDAAKVQTSTITYSDDSTITMAVAGEGAVAETDVRLISGATLYTETRPVTSTNYIGSANTTAANLSALDAAIGAKTAGKYIKAGDTDTVYTNLAALDTKIGTAKGLTGVYEASDDVETQIQNTAKKTIKSVSAATSNDAAKVQTSTITYSDDSTITMAVAGEGNDAETDVRLISGATLYTETRPVTSTNYIGSANTTAANLSALDAAIGAKTAGKYIAAGDTDTVYTNLAVLDTKIGTAKGLAGVYEATDDVETQIQNTAKKTIKSVSAATSSGDAAKVQTSTITYSDDSTITMAVAGEGSVAETDVRLISGATLYTETRPVTSTNYIASANTTAANLSALDAAIGAKTGGKYIKNGDTDTVYTNLAALDTKIGTAKGLTGVYEASDDVETQIQNTAKKTIKSVSAATSSGDAAKVQTSTITYSDDSTITMAVAGEGAVAETDVRLISGATLYTETRPVTSTNYIGGGNTTAANLSALDAAIGAKASGSYIKAGNTDTVYRNLSALDAAIGAVDTVGNYILKSRDETGGPAISMATNIAALDKAIGKTTGGYHISAQNGTSTTVATNLKELDDAIGGKASGNYISDGDTATVYSNLSALDTAIGAKASGNYISDGDTATVYTNLSALDTAIGAKASGNYISDADSATVYSNLSALDTKIGTATGGTNYDAGDTVETQIYKVDQSGVKNKVYTFDTNTGIATIETNASTDTDQKTAFQLKLASNGSIAVKDSGLISGEKVYAEVRPTDGLYVKEAKTAAANLNVLDTALGSVDTDGNYISKSRNDAGAPVVSLAANVAALDTAIGAKATGSYIKAGNTDTVYSNLSVLDTAVGAVDTVGNYILKSRDENGAPATSMATNIAALDKAIGKTTGGNYLSAQNGTSTTVATNLKELDDAIGARASGNYISDSDTATVYSNLSAIDTAIGKTAGGNYISEQDGSTVTVATNLKALDDAIGAKASGNYISDADTATVYSNLSALDTKIGVATGGTNYAAGDTVETQIYKVDQKALQEGQTFTLDSTRAGKTAQLKANDKVTTLATITMSVGSISSGNTGFVDGGTVYAYVLPKAEDGQTLYTVSTEKTTGENLARLDKKIGTAEDATNLKYVKDADSVSENLVSLDRAIVDAETLVYQDDAHVIHVGETLGGTEVSFAGAGGTRTLSGISQGAKEGEAATWDQIVAPGQFLYASEAKVGDKAKNSLYDNSGKLLATLQLGTVSSGSDGFVSGGTVYEALVKNDTYTVSYTTGADGSKSGSFTVLTNDGETAFTVNGILPAVGEEETTPYVPYTGDNETIAIDEKSHKISAKIGEVLSDSTGLLTGQAMYAELRPKEAGTYVNGSRTTAENISVLDEKTAEQAESIETLTGDMEIQKKLLSQTGDTVSVAEGVHATDISFASAGGETRILTGISKGTASGNAAVWDQIAKENQFIYAVDTAADDGHQKNVFYDNSGNALATLRIGTVSSGSDGFVSGGAVYNALVKNDTYTVKYGVGMDGLTTGTIEVLRNDGSVAFTVSGIQTGTATGEATPYTPYTGDNETITIDSDTHKISAKTGTIGEGDSGLVTGGAVYSELRPKEDGRYVSGQKTTAENLKSLDTEVGTNADAIAKIQTRVESHEKLVSQEGNTIRVGGDASITADTVTVASSGGDTRKLTGISKGTAESDAVNFSQIGTVTGKNVLDSSKNVAGNLDLIDKKIGTIAEGTYQAISVDATISENLIALDRTVGKTVVPDIEHLQDITKSEGATSKGGNSLALGNDSHAEGESSISFGTGASATSENSISIGKGSTVSGTDSIAVGTGHSVHGNNSGTFGDPSEIHGNNSYAFGNKNVIGDHAAGDGALGNNSFIVGNNSTVTGDHTFVLGNNVTTSANHSVVLGDNSTATEDNVVSVGSKGSERRIVNVAAGVNDTDAVNMSQLRAQLGGNVEALRSELTTDIRAVAAGAAALAALHPGTYDPNDKLSFAVGYGHYRDANAGALGAFYKPNEDILVSLGGTIGNGNPMMNAGISFKLGQRGKAKELYRTPSEMAREMKRLIEDNKALKTDNTAQAKKIDAQAEKIDAQAKQIDTQSKKIESLEADNQKMKAQIEKILQKLELSDTVEKSAVGK